MRQRLQILFFILLCQTARAEYRVFTLHISDKAATQIRQVQTTLDPLQYVGFYPLKDGEEISYIETWRCAGRTDFFKAHCDNPRLNSSTAPGLDRNPASQSPEVSK